MKTEVEPQAKRSILFAHKDIGDMDRGGVCVLFKALASGLSRKNWNVHVVTTGDLTLEGVETHKIDPIEDPREYSKAVTRVVESVKPDVAESSTWRAELLDYSEKSKRSAKVVVRADPSAGTLFSNVNELTEGERILCRNADLILAVSEFAKKDIEDNYQVTGVKVVYNGIPDSKSYPQNTTITSGEILDPSTNEAHSVNELPIEGIVKPSKINIVWIGKPTKMKGFDLLERIVELAPDNVNFIINTGYAPSEVVWKSENYQKCTFIRALTKQDQLSILRQSDVFLSTSTIEGFGIAVAEALNEGLPVILNTGCVVYHEFLPNDAVRLVDMINPTTVLNTIAENFDKKVFYSRNPRRFTQEQMVNDSISHYESLR